MIRRVLLSPPASPAYCLVLLLVGVVLGSAFTHWWQPQLGVLPGRPYHWTQDWEPGFPNYVQYQYRCPQTEECLELAKVVYYEAGVESWEGKAAVAHVVLTRTQSRHWPDSIQEVIHYRCQFSVTCDGSYKKPLAGPLWRQSLLVAELVYRGHLQDPTGGADHFYNPRLVKKPPRFARVYPLVAVIGRHHFHRRGSPHEVAYSSL